PLAVDPDGEGREVMLRVRTIGVDERLEADRLVVDELRATREKVWCRTGEHERGLRAGGEMCHLFALPGCEIEHEHVDRLLAPGSRSEIREGDPTPVGTEEHRRGEDPRLPGVL